MLTSHRIIWCALYYWAHTPHNDIIPIYEPPHYRMFDERPLCERFSWFVSIEHTCCICNMLNPPMEPQLEHILPNFEAAVYSLHSYGSGGSCCDILNSLVPATIRTRTHAASMSGAADSFLRSCEDMHIYIYTYIYHIACMFIVTACELCECVDSASFRNEHESHTNQYSMNHSVHDVRTYDLLNGAQ